MSQWNTTNRKLISMATEVTDDTCAYSASSMSVNDDRMKICFDWLPSQRRVGLSDGHPTLK